MRTQRFTIAVLAGGLCLAACSNRNRDAGAMPETTEGASGSAQSLEGTVMLAGSEPNVMVTLRADEGGSVNLMGALREELARLSGARVRVDGSIQPTGRRTMDVRDYRVLSVNGQTPYVGVLVRRDGAVWLDGDEAIRLVDPTADLRAQVGAKVWVVGRRTSDGVRPQSYGIIREP